MATKKIPKAKQKQPLIQISIETSLIFENNLCNIKAKIKLTMLIIGNKLSMAKFIPLINSFSTTVPKKLFLIFYFNRIGAL